ncbi:MAG: MATE family efflux transporter [Desulfovibrionaceae bacterium]
MKHSFFERFFSLAESKKLLALAGPVYIAQLSQVGMNFVDTAMAGQASAEDMAAVALASSIWTPVALFGVGCLLSLSPLIAQLVGARDYAKTSHVLRQGIVLSGLLSVVLMCFFYVISFQLQSFGLAPHLAALGGGYLRAVMWSLPAFFLFVSVRSLFEGYSRTRPAMVISIVGLLLNIPCNYVLIYGKFGLPALGAVGCGVATSFVYWVMALAMVFYARRDPSFADLGALFSPLWRRSAHTKRVDWSTIGQIMRIGLPSAMAMLFEVSLFAVTALLLARLGTVVIAGHQIAMNFSSVLFMSSLALGVTSTIRVSTCLGAGKVSGAHLAAWTALGAGVSCACFNALLVVCFREQIALIYNSDPEVVALAAHLLLFAAAFQVVDAVQAWGIGVLRGYNDTATISVVCLVCYWCIGLPLGYTLTYGYLTGTPWGAAGFWMAYITSLCVASCCYIWRINHLHRLDSQAVRIKLGLR